MTKKQIPKLHIKYAYPLDRERRDLFAKRNFGPYPSIEEVDKKVNEWRKIWENLNKGDKVFKLLIKITGVNLPRDLEMHIFGAGLPAMSNPLIMPIMNRDKKLFNDEEFLETAIHEIIHRFVGDLENNPGIKNYWKNIRKKYSKESIRAQNHIIVHAVLKIVLTELFGRKKLKSSLRSKHPDYMRAAAIVSEKGAENLVKEFRSYLTD